MNKNQWKKVLFKSGNQVMDKDHNIWNVLMVATTIKNQQIAFQLMKLRNGNGERDFSQTVFAKGGRTVNAARNKLVRKVGMNFKRVEYDSIQNNLKKVLD